MTAIPALLREELISGRYVVVVGAGVSCNASNEDGEHPPDWIEMLKRINGYALNRGLVTENQSDQIKQAIERYDLLRAAEILRILLGAYFHDAMREILVMPKFEPSAVHEDIASIGLIRAIITTNYDELLDTEIRRVSNNTIQILRHDSPDLARALRKPDPFMLKAHGCITDSISMIFCREDYRRLRHEAVAYRAAVNALLLTHTFLFLGYGMSDPDINMFLEDLRYTFKLSGGDHFILRPANEVSDEENRRLEYAYGLRTISYDPANNHEAFRQFVAELRNLAQS